MTMLLDKLPQHPGDAPALLANNESVSYAELRTSVDDFARYLLADKNDGAEERIAMLLPAGHDYVTASLGIWRAGDIPK